MMCGAVLGCFSFSSRCWPIIPDVFLIRIKQCRLVCVCCTSAGNNIQTFTQSNQKFQRNTGAHISVKC